MKPLQIGTIHREQVHLRDYRVESYLPYIFISKIMKQKFTRQFVKFYSPRSWTTVGQSHVAHPHGVHHPQSGEGTSDRMPSFDTDQATDFASAESILDTYCIIPKML